MLRLRTNLQKYPDIHVLLYLLDVTCYFKGHITMINAGYLFNLPSEKRISGILSPAWKEEWDGHVPGTSKQASSKIFRPPFRNVSAYRETCPCRDDRSMRKWLGYRRVLEVSCIAC